MYMARVEDGKILEFRNLTIAHIPDHKRALWWKVFSEGEGPVRKVELKEDHVLITYSFPPPTKEDVNEELRQKICSLLKVEGLDAALAKQINHTSRWLHLLMLKQDGLIDKEQEAELATLQKLFADIHSLRKAANEIQEGDLSSCKSSPLWPAV